MPAAAEEPNDGAEPPATDDSNTTDDNALDQVAVTVAVGRGGRTMISCDDGRTWIENQIETADDARCWGQPDGAVEEGDPRYIECDHHESHSTGLVYSHGWFFKSMGWGTPGRTLRSRDGVQWEEPAADFETTYLGLIAQGNRLFALGTPQPFASDDDGESWTELASLGWDAGHVRQATASADPNGSIVFFTDEGLWYSHDQGTSFVGPVVGPGQVRGMASSESTTVIAVTTGQLWTTVNGGAQWEQQTLGQRLATNPVWNGQAFYVWGEDGTGTTSGFSSVDGLQWDSFALPAPVHMESVGVTIGGEFVATNAKWNGGYENQLLFRSADGKVWETLSASAYEKGHPISHFASGRVAQNRYCP